MSEYQFMQYRTLTCLFVDAAIIGLALVAVVACAGGELRPVHGAGPTEPYREGQVLETASGRAVHMDTWLKELTQQGVVYLGEEHHNRFHIEAALKVLGVMVAQGRKPVLAMEMFGWDGQLALDRYLSGQEADRSTFLEQVRWVQNWGGPFDEYEPLVRFAKDRQLSLVAMNPPKTLVRLVATKGLTDAKSDPEMSRWGMRDERIVDDPLYRERIMDQLQQCHGGGDDTLYRLMYEASMVRDEGMAKTIADQLAIVQRGSDATAGPLVSYTGGGHIQYAVPVPNRVARRAGSQIRHVSIYMTAFERDRLSDLEEMIRDKIADYIWLTPIGAQGPPRRCR